MRQNKFWMLAATAALVIGGTSCSKSSTGGDGEGGESYPTTVRISVTQQMPVSVQGKAFGDANTATPTPEEQQVDDVTLYIFNSVGLFETAATMATASEVITTTTGTKYIYAIANKPSGWPGITLTPGTTTRAQFEAAEISINNVAGLTAIADPTSSPVAGFVMTNLGEPATATFVVGDETTPGNQITIRIGRAVAKINAEFNAATANQPNGKLTNVEYKVANNPVKMFAVPSYRSGGGYVNTPFFSEATVNTGNYFTETAFKSATGETTTVTYAVENSNAQVIKEGESTHLIIKGTYTPDVTYDKDGVLDATPLTAGTSFYRIYDKRAGTKGYTAKIYSEAPTTAEIDAVLGASGLTPEDPLDPTTTPGDYAVREYTGGTSYWGLWLKNPDPALTDLVDQYTIARNQYYYVSITSVSGPGEYDQGTVVDPTDPSTPVEADIAIQATVSVQPWSLIQQGGGI